MLTQTTKYALQALAFMVEAPEEWHEVQRLSKRLGIPANYLSKILGQLAKRGILESRKGWGGGFRIGRDPSTVPLDEVIRFLEGSDHARNCIFGFPVCSDSKPCPLHDEWKRVRSIYETMLLERTVADLRLGRIGPEKQRKKRQRGG